MSYRAYVHCARELLPPAVIEADALFDGCTNDTEPRCEAYEITPDGRLMGDGFPIEFGGTFGFCLFSRSNGGAWFELVATGSHGRIERVEIEKAWPPLDSCTGTLE